MGGCCPRPDGPVAGPSFLKEGRPSRDEGMTSLRGFTLVEGVVASAVLAIAVVALGASLSAGHMASYEFAQGRRATIACTNAWSLSVLASIAGKISMP